MKNVFFITIIVFFALLSCRSDEDSVQKIDQVINLYIDSAGQDMLNTKIAGSYISGRMNDVYGLTDNAPISFTIKKDADTIYYIEYLAGAKRIAVDSTSNSKTYESKITLILTKKINDSTNKITNDAITIQYLSTPEVFQVSKVWYNNTLRFTKLANEPNIVKIQK